MTYNPWPAGDLPAHWQRPELKQVMDRYALSDPRDVIKLFERKVADYAGSKYAVAVDSCTNALFLCLRYFYNSEDGDVFRIEVTIPPHTYISVPQTIKNAGYKLYFHNIQDGYKFKWDGFYRLDPYPIYDMAVRFTKNMYIPNTFCCLSFQIKKRLPIGKGGMILTDSLEAYNWLRKARYEGRDTDKPYDEDMIEFTGWNMYMTPEDAARGIMIFDELPEYNEDICDWSNYHDLRKQKVFQ